MAEQQESPPTFKLLSWNIDGLEKRSLLKRTMAVCDFIISHQPDCVFLQEVVPVTWFVLSSILNKRGFSCYSSVFPDFPYFNAILVCKASFSKIGIMEHRDLPTEMGRHLLQLPVTFNDVEIELITTHLESMRDFSTERKRQLRIAFEIMVELQESTRTTIFAGDLNVRDFEVEKVEVPPKIIDVWEACGSFEQHRFTWDTEQNDNLDFDTGTRRPKLRFDRMYLSPSDGRLQPKKFELVGKNRVRGCQKFPSDHWGMWAEFEVV